ncbi:MAG: hypothetical protein M1834_001243 [Cirrosporium novae-zelandiae]|nr:MAG: hypothetical protein M1834_001243 [Cirrosporium novae-zelandiae]
MPSKNFSCVLGIDVGGTNTDAVILQNSRVLAWHKNPTTADFYGGMFTAIRAIIEKASVAPEQITSVRIGTTQFVNAVLEQDGSKLDKVAVIRLCGPYTKGSPPFVDFPFKLRGLVEGHFGYVDGGFQVHGEQISELSVDQLKEQASIIRAKGIKSIVVVGVYSPSNPSQELSARSILATELGSSYDVSCSHTVGRLGFLERENASILNASLRRFARRVITGLRSAIRHLGKCRLYITLNDGTLSEASTAADYPVRCFSSGPTNSARGAALLAELDGTLGDIGGDGSEVLVVDVGGTTTDICALLESGFPRQSAAFVKIAGVRTNFTIPDVHSIGLGGGSIVRTYANEQVSVGPDSVGANLTTQAISFGGHTLTATDLVASDRSILDHFTPDVKSAALSKVKETVEAAIDLVKTKKGDATVLLVGGGSIIIGDSIEGVGRIFRPKFFEVANAVGAAIGKISGEVDTIAIPDGQGLEPLIENAKLLAKERCIAAGGNESTLQVVEIEVVPISYVTTRATRIIVRTVGDLTDEHRDMTDETVEVEEDMDICEPPPDFADNSQKLIGDITLEPIQQVDLETYRPKIENDIWFLSELDLDFLVDGAGVLGVGSCGEPYPSYLACLQVLRNGGQLKIRKQEAIPDDTTVLVAGFMGSPSVYLERVPGTEEVTTAIQAIISTTNTNKTTIAAIIPNEIGGLNAFEALLAAHRFGICVLNTDCVARAYPFVWQTVRCLNGVSVTPAAVSDGCGNCKVFKTPETPQTAETLMRSACTTFGSLAGMCINPLSGTEAKSLPPHSFSHAWKIGHTMALARMRKQNVVESVLKNTTTTPSSAVNGPSRLLFCGKIVSVERRVTGGFTRGDVLVEESVDGNGNGKKKGKRSLFVEFENENLVAVLRQENNKDKILACCPDLITFLSTTNGTPLGTSDYKYGLRVSVIALRAPPIWTSKRGLEVGGPGGFGIDVEYGDVVVGVGARKEEKGEDGGQEEGGYENPESVFDMFDMVASSEAGMGV